MTCAKQRALKHWDVPAMSATGIRFGKALQYTNILRDVPKDLRIGRCYFPSELLSRHGLQAGELLKPENAARARPALRELVALRPGTLRTRARLCARDSRPLHSLAPRVPLADFDRIADADGVGDAMPIG